MMKPAIIGTTAALSLVAGVIAARAAEPIVEAAPVYDWSGAYIGLQAGYAGGHENDDLSDNFINAPLLADDFSMHGFVGGVYGGLNYQMPSNFVFGFEGDFNGSSYKGDEDYEGVRAINTGTFSAFVPVAGNLEMESDWQASIRGRVGYAFDRTLFYGTGGVAYARAELSGDSPVISNTGTLDGSSEESDTETLVGYTVGLGIEHAFTDHWIGKLEGRYSDFESKTFDLGNLGDVKADFNQGQVLVGIAYKF